MIDNTKKNVDDLLAKATTHTVGGVTNWYLRLPEDAKPFIDELSNRVANEGAKANARVISEILSNEFDFEVSYSRVRNWLVKLEKQYAEKKS